MKSLSEFINENLILEFKEDLKPRTIIVMGGPGAGKTYWMQNNSRDFFKNRSMQYRQLDSDHNLKEKQREVCRKMAEDLISLYPQDDERNFGEVFHNFINAQQREFDKKSDQGGSPRTDLSKIKFRFVADWRKRINKAEYMSAARGKKVKEEYISAFFKEYFKDVFASDFSERSQSKKVYSRDLENKLKGEGEVLVSKSDTMVAITGDKLRKIEEIIELSGDSSITIVYLNVPEEISVAQDAKRDRSVGEKMIKEKLADIHKTWVELVNKYQDLGIFRMYEMVPSEKCIKAGKLFGTPADPAWIIGKEYINKNLIGK